MKKKGKIVVTLTSRFVAIDAHQCDNVYLLMSSTAKSYNFPKLSEAWVIFHGSKPEKKIESGISKSGGKATHYSILVK